MSLKVAYLGCKYCMSNSNERRSDAYEHDRELEAFVGVFKQCGIELVETDWEQVHPASSDFDLYFVRTTWNYVEAPDRFIAFLKDVQQHAPVVNDPELIQWNMSKRYLKELGDSGLSVIPSEFIGDGGATLGDLRQRLGSENIILKPVFGGGGFGQRKTKHTDDGNEFFGPEIFAQPFVPEIVKNGEVSFIFVGEQFSHCVKKTPAPGEYLIHSYHGGAEHPYTPSAKEVDEAFQFIRALSIVPIAARVDVVPTEKGVLLMELEVIEPHLFPQFGKDLPHMLAKAILDRIG